MFYFPAADLAGWGIVCTFAAVMIKQKIGLGQWVVMLLVAGGLYLITESFFISMGILLLLIVLEYVVEDINYRYKCRKEREREEKKEQ